MTRPPLRQISLASILPLGVGVGGVVVTMSRGQWDPMLANCYAAGDVLLELDDHEMPLRAYQRADVGDKEE